MTAAIKEFFVAKGKSITTEDGHFTEGQKVTLSEEDADLMRGLGFIDGGDEPEIERSNGPVFEPEEGPKIKVAAAKKAVK